MQNPVPMRRGVAEVFMDDGLARCWKAPEAPPGRDARKCRLVAGRPANFAQAAKRAYIAFLRTAIFTVFWAWIRPGLPCQGPGHAMIAAASFSTEQGAEPSALLLIVMKTARPWAAARAVSLARVVRVGGSS